MAKTIIMGQNVNVYLGSVMVGCARKIDITVKADKINTTCAGTENVKTGTPGKKEISWSIEGLYRQFDNTEEATNVSVEDWYDGLMADTEVTIKYKTAATGDKTYTLVGYAENWKISGSDGAETTFNVDGWANSIARTTNS